MIGQNQNLLWQLLKTTDKTQFTTSFLTSQPSHINQIETNTTSTKVNITIIFKKSHKTPIYLKSRLIIVYLEVIDKQNKYKLKKRIWKYLEKERRAELRRREGAAKCAATRELWSARIWERGFESEDLRVIWEWFLRVSCEVRGFEREDLRVRGRRFRDFERGQRWVNCV